MEFKKNEQQMLMDQQSQMHKQAAIRNDEDGTAAESVINGFIGKSYIHKVTDKSPQDFENFF